MVREYLRLLEALQLLRDLGDQRAPCALVCLDVPCALGCLDAPCALGCLDVPCALGCLGDLPCREVSAAAEAAHHRPAVRVHNLCS